MIPKPIRMLGVLIAGAIVTGSASPAVVAGREAANRSSAEETRGSPDRHRAAKRTQLYVRVSCSSWGDCSAIARGGTGVYESWQWYGAEETSDEGGSMSSANASAYCSAGYVLGVSAVVTDSSGATAAGDALIFCPY